MLLCLGAGFAKQRFCLYLEGQSVLGSLQGVIGPFPKGVGASTLLRASGPCCPWCLLLWFWGLSLEVPRDPGGCGFRDHLSRTPSNDPSTSEMGCDGPFPGHQAPTRMGLPTAVEEECSACKRPRDSENLLRQRSSRLLALTLGCLALGSQPKAGRDECKVVGIEGDAPLSPP